MSAMIFVAKQKILIAHVLLVCMFIINAFSASAKDNMSDRELYLRQLNEIETVEFFIEQGLSFPAEQPDPYYWTEFIKEITTFVLDNPFAPLAINHESTLKLGERIRSIVIRYCGFLYENPSRYVLQKSSKFCSWSDVYYSYNCYAFVLGISSRFVGPGSFSGGSWTAGTSVGGTVAKIRADLQAMGCTNIVTSTSPLAPVSGQTLICVRVSSTDYHFMKFIPSLGVWRHKPGNTLPLTYNYTPAGGGNWTNEHSKNNKDYAGSMSYNSTIMYIRFTP